MQVEPHRLVELAATSETVLTAMLADWDAARPDLEAACSALGDATGTLDVAYAYADSLADAGEVVGWLTQSLHLGVEGLVAAAQDVLRADDTVAEELHRTTNQVDDDGHVRGRGHGRGHGRGGH